VARDIGAGTQGFKRKHRHLRSDMMSRASGVAPAAKIPGIKPVSTKSPNTANTGEQPRYRRNHTDPSSGWVYMGTNLRSPHLRRRFTRRNPSGHPVGGSEIGFLTSLLKKPGTARCAMNKVVTVADRRLARSRPEYECTGLEPASSFKYPLRSVAWGSG